VAPQTKFPQIHEFVHNRYKDLSGFSFGGLLDRASVCDWVVSLRRRAKALTSLWLSINRA
jgi:hypothetical protein